MIEAREDGGGVVGRGVLGKRITQGGQAQDRGGGLALGAAGAVLTVRELVRCPGVDSQPGEAGEGGIGGQACHVEIAAVQRQDFPRVGAQGRRLVQAARVGAHNVVLRLYARAGEGAALGVVRVILAGVQ